MLHWADFGGNSKKVEM